MTKRKRTATPVEAKPDPVFQTRRWAEKGLGWLPNDWDAELKFDPKRGWVWIRRKPDDDSKERQL